MFTLDSFTHLLMAKTPPPLMEIDSSSSTLSRIDCLLLGTAPRARAHAVCTYGREVVAAVCVCPEVVRGGGSSVRVP